MHVSVEATGSLERQMTIQVPADRVEEEVNNRLRNLAREVKLDGFRPGKVPFNVVKKKFDSRVRQEVVAEVMRTTLYEALMQEKLNPAGGPRLEPVNMKPGEALEYKAIFEVYPEITLASMDGLSVEKPVVEISDTDVEKMIEKLQTQRATFDVVERAAQEGDQVKINFVGTIDGEEFSGNKGDDVELVLGSGQMVDGFEKQLEGAKAGDHRSVTVTFPEDYQGQEVAGKTAVFEVDVTHVAEAKLPELNDEFAQSFGIDGVDKMREEIRNNMQRELDMKLRTLTKQRVLDVLLEANEVELPQALVQEEIERNVEQMLGKRMESLSHLNLPPELFEEPARKRVAMGLLVAEVIKSQSIELDQERVEKELQSLAATYDQPDEVIQTYRKNRDMMTNIEGMVLEDQVIEHLMSQLKVEEKVMAFDEVMNNR